MNTDTSTPTVVSADARTRAWRTFVQGFGIDVTVAVVLALLPAFTGIEWTAAYWAALGLSVARTSLQAAVSYLARVLIPPKAAPAVGGDSGDAEIATAYPVDYLDTGHGSDDDDLPGEAYEVAK